MATVAQLNAYVDAANAAIDLGDWDLAEANMAKAGNVLNALPTEVRLGGEGVRFSAEYIADQLKYIQRKVAETKTRTGGAIRMISIKHKRIQ